MAWSWPTVTDRINQYNTWNGTSGHKGLDIDLDNGDPVFAPDGGSVIYAYGGDDVSPSSNGGYARMVKMVTNEGYTVILAHLLQPTVSAGQSVKKGQLVGYGDNTGKSSGPHLHFEVRKGTANIDPFTMYGDVSPPTGEGVPPPSGDAEPGSGTTINIPGVGEVDINDIFGFDVIAAQIEQIDWFKVAAVVVGVVLIVVGSAGLVAQENLRGGARIIGEAVKAAIK